MEVNRIYHGDCRGLGEQLEDASIDHIFCDPVYPEFWQYAWLGELATRVLKPGGSVVAKSGEVYRYQAETALRNGCNLDVMEHRPLLTEMYSGGFKSVWMHRVLKSGHPYIWFEKGKPNPNRGWPRTAFFGLKDKSRHKWGDGERGWAFLISRLSRPGDLILDPFTGSGTVPAVCKQFGRRWIGFELDLDTVELARRRIRETQPPLMIVENGRQGELI